MCVTVNVSSQICELFQNSRINDENFILHFNWSGMPPSAGQFFMIKPERTSVFLPRPISIFEYNESQKLVKFLIAKRGKGTEELSLLNRGEKVRLTGPFGNKWEAFLPESGKAALVGGSVGIAPLAALVAEKPDFNFDFYAGFKNGFKEKEEENKFIGSAKNAVKLVVTAEDGRNALDGRIVDYLFEPQNYNVIFACGSVPMLKAVKKKCEQKKIPCFLSMESRLACGAGACFGCTIRTVKGNRRCCADGPIFPAGDILFNE
jgi:dihydroorotate dehydrogenase electron transfer subunit